MGGGKKLSSSEGTFLREVLLVVLGMFFILLFSLLCVEVEHVITAAHLDWEPCVFS